MSIRPLTPQLAEKAREICHEDDPNKLQDALQQVKEWLALQPHIHARTDNQWLIAFIRGFRFDLEKVKTKLDLYYTCRHTASEFFQMHHKDAKFKELVNTGGIRSMNPEDTVVAFRQGVEEIPKVKYPGFYLPLPKLSDPAGPRVTLIRTGVFDMAEFGVLNAFAVAHVIDKILVVEDDNAIIAGNTIIVDFKNTKILPMLQLTSKQTRMLFTGPQDAMPFTTEETFHINVSEELQIFLNFTKLDGNSEKDQSHIYTDDYEEIYTKHGVSKEIMPVEYGGNGGTIMEIADHWMKKVEEYSAWLEDDLKFGTDESKRPGGKPKTSESMFGISVRSVFQVFESDCITQ